jgi:hypothetical protein
MYEKYEDDEIEIQQKIHLSAKNLTQAVAIAIKMNESSIISELGIVITERIPGCGQHCFVNKISGKPYVRKKTGKKGTAEWKRFIDKEKTVWEVEPKKHIIIKKIDEQEKKEIMQHLDEICKI